MLQTVESGFVCMGNPRGDWLMQVKPSGSIGLTTELSGRGRGCNCSHTCWLFALLLKKFNCVRKKHVFISRTNLTIWFYIVANNKNTFELRPLEDIILNLSADTKSFKFYTSPYFFFWSGHYLELVCKIMRLFKYFMALKKLTVLKIKP